MSVVVDFDSGPFERLNLPGVLITLTWKSIILSWLEALMVDLKKNKVTKA